MSNKKFTPVRGIEDKIAGHVMGFHDGFVYFATDTGKIYMDYTDEEGVDHARVPFGGGAGGGSGSNSGIFFAKRPVTEDEKLDDNLVFSMDDHIEGKVYPEKDDLILNSEDGCFYRVLSTNKVTAEVVGARLTVAGNGGGGNGGASSLAEDISLTIESLPDTIINGKSQTLYFTATSALNNKGNPIDPQVKITWRLESTDDGTNYTVYKTFNITVPSGERYGIDVGSHAKHSSMSRVVLIATQDNHNSTVTRSTSFSTSDLALTTPSSFSNLTYFDYNQVQLDVTAKGNMDKIVECYFDDMEVPYKTQIMSASDIEDISFNIDPDDAKNGYHTIKVRLFQSVDGKKGAEVDPLLFEIAVWDGRTQTPIVWLGDYKSQYYSYDVIQIPFRVFDPKNPESTVVYFKRNNIDLPNSPQTITDMVNYSYFEIADAELDIINRYSISCGEGDYETIRRIEITVVQDPTRKDFGVQRTQFLDFEINTVGSGRSNSESESQRQVLNVSRKVEKVDGIDTNVPVYAKFDNFNWFNNGWYRDKQEGNKTCLRVSNGASLSVPIGTMTFGGNSAESHSIEVCFKIRNVQDYSNLIRNVTRYVNDDELYAMFYDSETATYLTDYTNYDSFLAWFFKNNYYPFEDPDTKEERAMTYDDLEFNYIDKLINLSNVACGYYSGDTKSAIGLCLGPQDAFFSNGTNTVSVSYIEDRIITLSAIYDNSNKLMYIYLNGILTGVIKSTKDGFKINTDKLVFNSQYCDIDIYKLRVYRTGLNVNDVVMNYAADFEDINIYDQNKLAEYNKNINEYQLKLGNIETYNLNHPQSPLMPYIIFDTTNSNNGNKLPYAKVVDVKVGVEFVNMPLEVAYQSGELEELAGPKGDKLWADGDSAIEKAEAVKKYYKHHCPSFKGDNINLAVQGTSSEFYPRRNYKMKTKTDYDDDGEERVHIFLNRGPFAADYNADMAGVAMSPFVLYTGTYNKDLTYYIDKAGSEVVEFTAERPFQSGKYYIKNEKYVELGKEKTRQKYWYMDNYTAGTTKWTMKIDFMESSGSYNMGFTNLVHYGYSKHPLDDYKKAGAFTSLKENKETGEKTYDPAPNFDTSEYRTCTQGLRTMAFHRFGTGANDYRYIGMYNMLLDKGSDENYGFKLDKTAGFTPCAKFVKNKKITKIAECWEFQNNARTFCSFRDPMLRKDLSFDVFETESDGITIKKDAQGKPIRVLNSVRSGPVVLDAFEYRYHTDSDILDYIFDPIKEADKYKSEDVQDYMKEKGVEFLFNKDDPQENLEDRADFTLDRYGNWEKAVAWVWSTNTELVTKQGDYEEINVGKKLWAPAAFHIQDASGEYIVDPGTEWDANQIYFEYNDEEKAYLNAYVSNLLFTNPDYSFYTKVGDSFVIANNSKMDNFDEVATYYILKSYSDEELAIKADRLVQKCNDDTFTPGKVYYTYDGSQRCGKAAKVADVTADNYEKGKFYEGITVTYGKRSYKYDTQEYRADKFINELEDHFDLEYMATYWVMTEVFECYDSRGKNAMFATWGPLKEGGEYIWYPIFYDLDTQLGINNTGIPSFEYNVDATIDGNYSTSDSILWNNFYKYFKSSAILAKYKHLRGVNAGVEWKALTNPPISTVDKIINWYNTDPNETKRIEHRGTRPLIAVNLDEYYKYITITNPLGVSDGSTGHSASNTSGDQVYDAQGTYFYALQGNRSLSGYQFLTNRLEYIDSWLNQGNYQRGGANRIRSRMAANNPTKTSDIWVETDNNPYYNAEGKKINKFDAEHWVTLTPTHSSYVTLGDDSEAYPSQKYDGINPLKFNISAVENGVRKSAGYPEQLLYIYGINQMQDLGDLSGLYLQEFEISGEAKKLTSLRLGHDGLMPVDENIPTEGDGRVVEINGKKYYKWYNNKVNQPSIPAGADASGMPLLKEANFCNIQINTGTPVLDLTSCEKLENFRATGSNFNSVMFAEGVALNTLYLPNSVKSLELKEARLLKNLITEYEYPTVNAEGKLVAKPGLFLEGMFDSNATSIETLNIIGGGLGYDSYKLLKKYFEIRQNQGNVSNINFTNVVWAPYIKQIEGDVYETGAQYFQDDGHYGLKTYTYNNLNWDIDVANGIVYKLNTAAKQVDINQITDISMLEAFITSDKFVKNDAVDIPEITGIIYVNNSADNKVDEFRIRNEIQPKYPNLTFFFANVNKAYTAKFLLMETDEGETGRYTLVGSQTITEGWFKNPIDEYGTTFMKHKPNNDFYGWAKKNSLNADIIVNIDKSINKWDNQSLQTGVYDYIYYAVCPVHSWTVKFYSDGELFVTDKIPHESIITGPSAAPWKDDSALDADPNYGPSFTYKILGYNRNANATAPMDLSTFPITEDIELYTIWDPTPVSVYDNIHPEYFYEVATATYSEPGGDAKYNIDGIRLGLKTAVRGKITIPAVFNGKPVVEIDPSFGMSSIPGKEETIDMGGKWTGIRNGTNVTHIFFQKADNGMTNVRYIRPLSFYRTLNLQYFEFADGIRAIGKNAFFFSQNSSAEVTSLTSSVIAGTIKKLEEGAFRRAFAPSVTSIEIGSEVTDIGKNAFGVYSEISSIANVSIGSQNNPSKLSLTSNASYYPIMNFDTDVVNIQFYTVNSNYNVGSSYIYNNFAGSGVNVETPLLN